ncbi:MAG: hypothetical protein ACXW4U_08165 [Anaerolineales bacterium]
MMPANGLRSRSAPAARRGLHAVLGGFELTSALLRVVLNFFPIAPDVPSNDMGFCYS